jgi:proteic killer suppression protein
MQRLIAVTGNVTLYRVIKSFRHRGVERFFRTGSKAGIQPKHAGKLRLQLFALDSAKQPADLRAPGWKLHRSPASLKITGRSASAEIGGSRSSLKARMRSSWTYQDYH